MSPKIIYSFIAVALVWIIGFTTYTHLWSRDFDVADIQTQLTWTKLSIDTQAIQEENSKKYDYYQLYIYPKTYSLECINNDSICAWILQHQERLKDYNLKFIWKDLKVSSTDDIVFDFNFSNYKIKQHYLKTIFEDLFVRDNSAKKPKTIAQEICESGIINSIPWWSFEDEEVQKRILEECQWTDIISDLTFAFWGIESEGEKNNNISLKLSIATMRLVYKFFIKENWKYIEKETQEKIIENPLELEASIDLSEF